MNFLLLFMWPPYIISAEFHCSVALINVCCLSSLSRSYLSTPLFNSWRGADRNAANNVPTSSSLPRTGEIKLYFWCPWLSSHSHSSSSQSKQERDADKTLINSLTMTCQVQLRCFEPLITVQPRSCDSCWLMQNLFPTQLSDEFAHTHRCCAETRGAHVRLWKEQEALLAQWSSVWTTVQMLNFLCAVLISHQRSPFHL